MNAATNAEYDVIVLGGGGSGLAAAIEARSLGRKVVVVEKGKNVGGTTAWSIGSISATNTPHQLAKGIKDFQLWYAEQTLNHAAGTPAVPVTAAR